MSIIDNFRKLAEKGSAHVPDGEINFTPTGDPYEVLLYGPRFQFLHGVEVNTTHRVGCANVVFTLDQCDGHFRDFPIVPGVLMVEALAQLCAATALTIVQNNDLSFRFSAADDIHFHKQAIPERELRAIVLWNRSEKRAARQRFVTALYNEADQLTCSAIVIGFATCNGEVTGL